MTRLAYVDAIAGVAGDMLLGALLDAGADPARVAAGLRRLGLPGLELVTAAEERHGIAACRVVSVAAPPDPDRPEPSRTWADVRALIDAGDLPERARARSQAVFAALARAEGRVHGVPAEAVHFHEVGALDAIGDVCAIALALDELDVDELACSSLPAARGLLQSAHGTLPLPAPATLELLRGALLHGVDGEAELVTPTGAAVIAALAVEHGPLPPLRLESVGYGAGARTLADRPNVVRVLIGRRVPAAAGGHGAAVLIETNLDDLSPELVPAAAERCFAAGALDVWVVPVQMKKGRPGVVFSALARPEDEEPVARAVLLETSALGVRVTPARRWELERSWSAVEVAGERVRVKLGALDGRTVNAAPEYDDCLAVARRTGRPLKAVWAAALAAAAASYGPAPAAATETAPGNER
ncbi:MAG: nickel pincer cofactor biosynthesis protein LarC [Solirubrobacteraceae bacterium]